MAIDRRYPDFVILVDPCTMEPYVASGGGGGIASSVSLVDGANVLISGSNPLPVSVAPITVSSLPNVTVSSLPPLPTGANVIGAVTQSGVWSVQQGGAPWSVSPSGTWNVTVNTALPTGSNVIGGVTQSGVWSVALGAGAASIGTVAQGAAGLTAWKVDGAGGSFPVSGSVSISGSVTVAGTVAATQSGAWNVAVNTALPAGTNLLGKVDVNSLPALSAGANVIGAVTQSGAWTVTVNAALPTGTNVIGAVTQSGTWNVTVNAALPTGANVIGAVTQSGTWNVTVNAALPTGSNVIGAVTQSGSWTVQQGGAPWSVSGSGTFTVSQANLTTADYDSGAGTTTQVMVGLCVPASGGPVAVPGDGTNGLKVQVTNIPPVSQSGAWNVTVNAALPTGGNVIGAVTQSGTWTVQQGSAPWSASQSGIWNVTVNAALPTGTNVIGAVTQSGTWNVTVNAALPTGGNVIGGVTQSGTWTVQQGGAPWSVSGSGTFTVAQTNLATADYDTGAGTTTQSMIGLALPASGGPVAAPGDSTNGLKVNVTNASLATTQSGTWTVQQGSAPWSVSQSGVWAVGLSTGANVIGAVTQSGAWNVTVNTALPTGANVIGAVTQSGTWNVTTPDLLTSVVLNAATQTATVNTTGRGTATFGVVPSADWAGTITLQASPDGTNWHALIGRDSTGVVGSTFTPAAGTTVSYMATCSAFAYGVRLIVATRTAGQIVVYGNTSVSAGGVTLTQSLPTGANVIGAVTQSGTWNVTVNASLPAGGAVIGGVTQSGTWTVQQGSAPWSVSQSGSWLAQGAVAAAVSLAGVNPVVTGINGPGGVARFLTSAASTRNTDGTALVGVGIQAWDNTNSLYRDLQVDAAKNLLVGVNTALPAGTNALGGVTQSGTWSVGLAAGSSVVGGVLITDNSSGQTVTVDTREGRGMLAVRDIESRRLLEQLLLEMTGIKDELQRQRRPVFQRTTDIALRREDLETR